MSAGWIGVDLDGTLAHYEYGSHADWSPTKIGAPVPTMVERVQRWLAAGYEVRVFTARVSGKANLEIRTAIADWCRKHIGEVLPITCTKDYAMLELWDDRAVQVEPNTGRPIGHSTRGLE